MREQEEAPPDPGVPAFPRRRRAVWWPVGAVTVVIAGLVFVFATSKPNRGSASSPLIGKPAPAVSGPSLFDGAPVSMSSFAGRWVLVNFAASWCVPCRTETPQLANFAAEHAKNGDAIVVEVEYDEADKASLRSFLLANRATWPAIDDGPAVVAYGVGGIPESFLIDPAGTVIAKFIGGVTATEVDAVISRAQG